MEDWLYYFNHYRVLAQHIIAFLLAAAAWRWGGGPERWLNATFVATMVLPVYILWWLFPARSIMQPFLPAYLFVDFVATILFVGIALHANRNYPLWIAGFQLVALGAHLVKLIGVGVSPFALTVLITGPSYCQLLVLIVGFIRHVRRQHRFGDYRAWRIQPVSPYGHPV